MQRRICYYGSIILTTICMFSVFDCFRASETACEQVFSRLLMGTPLWRRSKRLPASVLWLGRSTGFAPTPSRRHSTDTFFETPTPLSLPHHPEGIPPTLPSKHQQILFQIPKKRSKRIYIYGLSEKSKSGIPKNRQNASI